MKICIVQYTKRSEKMDNNLKGVKKMDNNPNFKIIDEKLTRAFDEYPVRQKEEELIEIINTFLQTDNNNFREIIKIYISKAVGVKFELAEGSQVLEKLRVLAGLLMAYDDLKEKCELINATTLIVRAESKGLISSDKRIFFEAIAKPCLSENQFYELVDISPEDNGTKKDYIFTDGKGHFKVNEVALAMHLKKNYVYDSGIFYSVDGVTGEVAVKNAIYRLIKYFVPVKTDSVVKSVYENLKNECLSEMPIELHKIHVLNGTLSQNEDKQFTIFTPQKEICRNRIATNYYDTAEKPKRFLAYLSELLPDTSIRTVQQYIGICLLPTNELQLLLCLLGDGGEGKSVLASTVAEIFGDANVMNDHLENVDKNRFVLANLENKLLFIDDDLSEHALINSNILKTVVTAETKMQIERKHEQSNTTKLYARLLCCGNFTISSLYDHSDAFKRRILNIRVKQKNRKKDESRLVETLKEERESILKWAVDGLNDYLKTGELFISEDIRKENEEVWAELDSIEQWLTNSEYLVFGDDKQATTRILYGEYEAYCKQNGRKYIDKIHTFSKELTDKVKKHQYGGYTITPNKHVSMPELKLTISARGFKGIGISRERVTRYILPEDTDTQQAETLAEKKKYIKPYE